MSIPPSDHHQSENAFTYHQGAEAGTQMTEQPYQKESVKYILINGGSNKYCSTVQNGRL